MIFLIGLRVIILNLIEFGYLEYLLLIKGGIIHNINNNYPHVNNFVRRISQYTPTYVRKCLFLFCYTHPESPTVPTLFPVIHNNYPYY